MDEENKKCEFYYDLYYFPLSSLIGWISDRTVIQLTAVKGKQSLPLLHLRSLLPSISALFCFVLSLSLSKPGAAASEVCLFVFFRWSFHPRSCVVSRLLQKKALWDPFVKILLLLLLLFLLRFFLFFFRVEGSASKGFGIERDLCAYKTNACSSSIRLKFVAGIVFAWIFVYIRFELSLRFCSLFLLCVRARVCETLVPLACRVHCLHLIRSNYVFLAYFLLDFPCILASRFVSPLDFREWLYSG